MKAIISRPQPKASAIEKALFAMTRAQANPSRGDKDEIAKLIFGDDRIVSQIVERGAAPLGTTSGSGWASQLVQNLVADFVDTLAPLSAAARLIPQGLQVNMAGAGTMKVPAREGAPSTTVAWVGEGAPIPVRAFTINDDAELSPKKFGFIIGVSRELAKRANGEAVIRQLMREDAASTLDAAYFSAVVGDAATHPGLLDGVSALTGYGGGDRTAIEWDLAALTDVVAPRGSGQVAFVVSPKRAARFAILAPDLNRELTMYPSLAIPDDRVIAVDPLSLVHGFGNDFDLDASEGATLHMSDDPDPISASGVADPVRSYFQTASIAMRLIGDVAFAARRPNAVAFVNSVTW